MGAGTFFDQVNAILIPEKDGKSTEDQIKAVDGDLAKLHPAYTNEETMLQTLKKLGKDDVKYQVLPDTWARVMHPKGSGYKTMSDVVIDSVLKFGATGADGAAAPDARIGDKQPEGDAKVGAIGEGEEPVPDPNSQDKQPEEQPKVGAEEEAVPDSHLQERPDPQG